MKVGLHDALEFEAGSALAMPFDNAMFGAAMTLHVAMKIPDRVSLGETVKRVADVALEVLG